MAAHKVSPYKRRKLKTETQVFLIWTKESDNDSESWNRMGCKPAKCCCRKDNDNLSIGSVAIDNAKPVVDENPQDFLGTTYILEPEPQYTEFGAVADYDNEVYDEVATEPVQTGVIQVNHKPSFGYVNVGYGADDVAVSTRDKLPSEKEKIHQPVMNELSRALQSRTEHINQ